MTYSLAMQIEELRAELSACLDRDERLQIESELAGAMWELAQAREELETAIAELDGLAEVEPPF